MLSKTFVFSKIEKTSQKIEDDLNGFLKDHEFKYAAQNESATKGKFIVTVFANPKKSSTMRAKVFKDQHVNKLEERINEFLAKHGMKFATQTFVGSSVYTIIFYDTKVDDKKDDKTGTTPATTTSTTDTTSNGTNQN